MHREHIKVTNIIHCDLDAFFATVEQLDNPALRGKPVVVGGDINARGVVSTCSYEARAFGVKSAMPIAQAIRLCPQAVFLPVNMSRYHELSKQVFAVLSDYTPVMEPVSIDEAFLDVSRSLLLFESPNSIGHMIKQRVQSELGLTISVGISYNKYLAKLASDMDKPDGFRIITATEARGLLKPLPVSRLWGVGEKTGKILNRMGIKTIGEIQDVSPDWLEDRLGASGRILWELAQGIDERPVESGHERKSIGRELTFSEDICDMEVLYNLINRFSAELCRKLRQDDSNTATITIKMRYSNFKTITRSHTVVPTNSDQIVAEIALALLHQCYDDRESLRLFGLSLGNLSPATGLKQGSLFLDESARGNKSIDALMDDIRERFGSGAIKRANLLPPNGNDHNK